MERFPPQGGSNEDQNQAEDITVPISIPPSRGLSHIGWFVEVAAVIVTFATVATTLVVVVAICLIQQRKGSDLTNIYDNPVPIKEAVVVHQRVVFGGSELKTGIDCSGDYTKKPLDT